MGRGHWGQRVELGSRSKLGRRWRLASYEAVRLSGGVFDGLILVEGGRSPYQPQARLRGMTGSRPRPHVGPSKLRSGGAEGRSDGRGASTRAAGRPGRRHVHGLPARRPRARRDLPRALRCLALGLVPVGAAPYQPQLPELSPWLPMQTGCCIGTSAPYLVEPFLTLQECERLCNRSRCASLEHDPWAGGGCTLWRTPAGGLGCTLGDRVCWSGGPASGAARTSEELRWHAREAFDYIDCAGYNGLFDWVRGVSASEALRGGLRALYPTLRGGILTSGEYFGVAPFGDTAAFFGRDNFEYMGGVVTGWYRGLRSMMRGEVDPRALRAGELRAAVGCPYGFLYLLYLALLAFRAEGAAEDAARASWALRVQYWALAGGLESEADLIQSSGWLFSSWDIVAATLDLDPDPGASPPEPTYAAHAARRPVPPASLPPLLELLPLPATPPPPPRASGLCAAATQRIATLGTQRQNQMHQLSALRAAWEGVCGSRPSLEVVFLYTPAGPLSDYELGAAGENLDWRSEAQEWHGMRASFLPGSLEGLRSLAEVQEDLAGWLRSAPLRDAALLLCGEPVYVCTAAARALDESTDADAVRPSPPLLGHLGMALLHQHSSTSTVLGSRESVARFLRQFLELLARPGTCVMAANRLSIEQIYWQVGVRLPLAEFAGIHLVPSSRREPGPRWRGKPGTRGRPGRVGATRQARRAIQAGQPRPAKQPGGGSAGPGRGRRGACGVPRGRSSSGRSTPSWRTSSSRR